MKPPNYKVLFLGLSFIGILALSGFLILLYYFIYPRLIAFHKNLPIIISGIIAIVVLFLLVEFFVISLIIISETKKIKLSKREYKFMRFFFSLILLFGKMFHIDIDVIRNSFIEINNTIVRSLKGKISGERLLILLPHCLQYSKCPRKITEVIDNCAECGKCPISDLIEFGRKCKANISVATGGTIARRIIAEIKPSAIIAVACERDLTSGIQDTFPLPVIGIVNERPEGPCKDTRVSLIKVKEAINFFTGKDITID